MFGLFESAFGSAPSAEELAAKHDTSFVGRRDIGLVAYAGNGQPAGYYGVFPISIRVGGHRHIVAQSGDTMVHPDHSGKGLFITLAKATYDLAKAEQIEGVFGFPSPSSYPGFVKRLEWQHFENIRRYRFIVPTLPFSELLWRFRPARRLLLAWQSFLFGMFEPGQTFPGPLMDSDLDCIDRTEGYWAYKLAQPTVRIVKIAGVEAVIKFEGSLGMGDINTTDPAKIKRVLRHLKLAAF